jgi:hypothetical protein
VLNVAVRYNHIKLVKLLLSDPRIEDLSPAVLEAINEKQLDSLKLLLLDQRVTNVSFALVAAILQGNLEAAKLLLADPRVDTSYNDQAALRTAIMKKRFDGLKLLLAAKRVTNSSFFQTAISDAIYANFDEGAKLLLADRAFNPSALRAACFQGKPDLIRLLLADERVDPTVNNQDVVRDALNTWRGSRLDSVVVLLSDPRVVVPIDQLKPDRPILTALMMLRRSFRQERSRDPNLSSEFNSLITEIESIESKRRAFLDAHLIPDLVGLCLDYVPDLFSNFIPARIPFSQLGLDRCWSWKFVVHMDLSEAPRYFSFQSLSTL